MEKQSTKGRKSYSPEISKEYFSDRFTTALEEWKEKTKLNEGDFAKRIYRSQNSITGYKQGTKMPYSDTVSLMVEEFQKAGLDITMEYFYPSSREDKYKYGDKYVGTLVQNRMDMAEKIDLSLDFLRFIWDKVDTSTYPVWTPLNLNCGLFMDASYKRMSPAETKILVKATDSMPTGFLQVKTDEGIYVLSIVDLCVLKEMQKQVQCFIEYLFLQRRKEMEEQLKEANKQFKPEIGGVKMEGAPLSGKEIIAIDKYMEFILGDKGYGKYFELGKRLLKEYDSDTH